MTKISYWMVKPSLDWTFFVLGHRMGRTVGFGPPSGMDGIILGCPNCPWDTGWEGQWDLGHPVGWMRLSWDVPIVLGIREGQWDLGHPVGQVGLS